MLTSYTKSLRAAFAFAFVVAGICAFAQSGGN